MLWNATLSRWHFTQGHTSILVHFQEPLLRSIFLQVNSWGTPHHIFLQQITNKHTPSLGQITDVSHDLQSPEWCGSCLPPTSTHTHLWLTHPMTTTPACFQFPKESNFPHETFVTPSGHNTSQRPQHSHSSHTQAHVHMHTHSANSNSSLQLSAECHLLKVGPSLAPNLN